MHQQTRILFIVIFLLLVLLTNGCATFKPMALTNGADSVDLSKESVALMTVKTKNVYKPDYQPGVTVVQVLDLAKDKNGDREIFAFEPGVPYRQVEKEYNEYLISIKLKPGKYKLTRLIGMSHSVFIHGSFSVPVYSDFEIKPNEMIYLGRIEAVNREQQNDDELAAGSIIPLIDQGISGYSGGTFDVKIYDNFDKDISLFKQQYSAINGHKVANRSLPQWQRRSEEEIDEIVARLEK